MKFVFIFLIIATGCSTLYINSIASKSDLYSTARCWKTTHIDTLTNMQHLQTLIDMILLSYQITQESCRMIMAKLTIQEELLKIKTPSISDSWQANMNVSNNDTTHLEQAIDCIKQSQIVYQELFSKIQKIGPPLILINPEPTKTLITHLKTALIAWGKQQHEITAQLSLIQHEFTLATATISDIKLLFETTFHASDIKHAQLKKAAGYVTKTYKDIEGVIAHLARVRKDSIEKLQLFFSRFFNTYYSVIYESLNMCQKTDFITQATPDGKLPLPDAFFI
ncbi:MAG TPA: hypothetical protein VLG50_01240 [Candidatus Saccharimonadales bacterium]|nr:hypothetical protein [Candidatus Saccharimonadales bacterium]